MQCPGCLKILGHTTQERTQEYIGKGLLSVDVCQGLVLSAQTFRDAHRPEEGPSRKAQCASCKAPVGKMLIADETLVVHKGSVSIYEIPQMLNVSSSADVAGAVSTPAQTSVQPSEYIQNRHPGTQMDVSRTELRSIVRREVANARAKWAADLATEKSMQLLVQELINDEMAKVKFTLLALNNRMNTLVEELTFDEKQQSRSEGMHSDEEDEGMDEDEGKPLRKPEEELQSTGAASDQEDDESPKGRLQRSSDSNQDRKLDRTKSGTVKGGGTSRKVKEETIQEIDNQNTSRLRASRSSTSNGAHGSMGGEEFKEDKEERQGNYLTRNSSSASRKAFVRGDKFGEGEVRSKKRSLPTARGSRRDSNLREDHKNQDSVTFESEDDGDDSDRFDFGASSFKRPTSTRSKANKSRRVIYLDEDDDDDAEIREMDDSDYN